LLMMKMLDGGKSHKTGRPPGGFADSTRGPKAPNREERSNKMIVSILAAQINDEIQAGRYFWACGIIKETANLWKHPLNRNLLNVTARIMAEYYISL